VISAGGWATRWARANQNAGAQLFAGNKAGLQKQRVETFFVTIFWIYRRIGHDRTFLILFFFMFYHVLFALQSSGYTDGHCTHCLPRVLRFAADDGCL